MSCLRQIFKLCILSALISVSFSEDQTCPTFTKSEDVTKLTGTWYVVRGIEHKAVKQSVTNKAAKSCPQLKIEIEASSEVKISWLKKNTTTEQINYFRIKGDKSNILIKQSKEGNKQSIERIQVLKLDDNYITITMCDLGSRVASAVLSRNPVFDDSHVSRATNLLTAQGLSVPNVYNRCTGS
ncbi:uncharacterized protein LOC120351127 [Nilaparvata lugens]|uniref:uncharacterized protein LOC111045369 n=1 Tax=Nilaparvata lugens TaxID=108931 RepID=UPI00193E93C3|nr:uncharacterized protein LOC111045369 [Nilaparvata lugens]XP_039283156.1 uncharacterized protein LOC120351127 [Nilaparvata lugens]